MNVILDQNQHKTDIKRKILYGAILAICLISILVVIYVQISKADEDVNNNEKNDSTISDEKYLQAQNEFENIFVNETNNQIGQDILITNKIKEDDDIIGVSYESTDKLSGKYSLNVTIPYININNSVVQKYNSQIEQIFKQKALDIIENSASQDVVYTVNYVAYINENNILSIAIRSILKEGTNAQRTIIQTYNYDFKNNKEVTLTDILEIKQLNSKDIENKVREKIKQEQEQDEELKSLGFDIFERDYTSDVYKVENTTEFFLGTDNLLYLVYAYGNDNFTNKYDVVIF